MYNLANHTETIYERKINPNFYNNLQQTILDVSKK